MKQLRALFISLILAGCGGVGYIWYTPDMPDECYDKGTLKRKDPKNDIPMTECKPGAGMQAKCGVFLLDELKRLLAENERLKTELMDCQKNCQH